MNVYEPTSSTVREKTQRKVTSEIYNDIFLSVDQQMKLEPWSVMGDVLNYLETDMSTRSRIFVFLNVEINELLM